MQNKLIFEKGRIVKEQKYNDRNYVNIQKAKLTKLERYGDENYRDVKKLRQTCIERYGVSSFSKSQQYKITRRENSIVKYGIAEPNNTESAK